MAAMPHRVLSFFIRTFSQEHFWNSKYPKCVVILPLGYMPITGLYNVDIRAFCVNPNIHELQEIVKDIKNFDCDDQKALACLNWVIDNFTYTSDKAQFGLPEYWMMPSEALLTRKGDCDDGAILLRNLMRASGIADWKIRLTAGAVHTGEGHCYVTYYVEKRGYWVSLDWCYHPSRLKVSERPDYKESKIYGEVWWSWNEKFTFMKGVK